MPAPVQPALTLPDVQQAFREIAFTKPTLHVQPEGNVTLVNLPTYYQVRWPSAGVHPGEVATVKLLGRSVRIRPAGRSFTYRFGDGTNLGPTADAGGSYPDGGIQHTYDSPAQARVSVAARYSGEFSVDGGEWQDVGQTIDIQGPVVGIQVREARARLEAG